MPKKPAKKSKPTKKPKADIELISYQPKDKVKPQVKMGSLDGISKPIGVKACNGHPIMDIEKVVDMRLRGAKLEEIARYYGVSNQAVSDRLSKVMADYGEIDTETFKKKKADLLAYSQAKLLTSLTPDKIKDMGGRDTVVAFGILHDKEADLRGTSPVMVGVNAITSLVDALKGYQSPAIEAVCTDVTPTDAPDTGL